MRARIVLLALLAVAANRAECGRDPPAYDPCAGKACGEGCTVCPPGATDCAETAVVKACDPQARCVPQQPGMCGTADACAGRACGEACVIDPPCRLVDPPCLVASIEGRCDASGTCLPLGLPMPLCPPHPDCEGKACGDSCNPCGPDRTCPTLIASACDRFGNCAGDVPWLCYDPCAGKACGAGCTMCPPLPDGEGCFETGDVKACDAAGRCVSQASAVCR